MLDERSKRPPVFVYREVVIVVTTSLRASFSRDKVEWRQDAGRQSKRSCELSSMYRGRFGGIREVSIAMNMIVRIPESDR